MLVNLTLSNLDFHHWQASFAAFQRCSRLRSGTAAQNARYCACLCPRYSYGEQLWKGSLVRQICVADITAKCLRSPWKCDLTSDESSLPRRPVLPHCLKLHLTLLHIITG